MAKLLSDNINFLLLRRMFSATVEKPRGKQVGSMIKKTTEVKIGTSGTRESQVFWMRDPKTGNWLPENRFDEVDVVELRERFLPKKRDV